MAFQAQSGKPALNDSAKRSSDEGLEGSDRTHVASNHKGSNDEPCSCAALVNEIAGAAVPSEGASPGSISSTEPSVPSRETLQPTKPVVQAQELYQASQPAQETFSATVVLQHPTPGMNASEETNATFAPTNTTRSAMDGNASVGDVTASASETLLQNDTKEQLEGRLGSLKAGANSPLKANGIVGSQPVDEPSPHSSNASASGDSEDESTVNRQHTKKSRSKDPVKLISFDNKKETSPFSALQSAASLLSLGATLRKIGTSVKSDDTSGSASSVSGDSETVDVEAQHPTGSSAMIVEKPSSNDVLCGRGRGFFNHPGNRQMLKIISKYMKHYRTANKRSKAEIVREVTKQLDATGGRFLKRFPGAQGAWTEATKEERYKKICHCLREEKNMKMADPNAASRKNSDKQRNSHAKQAMKRKNASASASTMKQEKPHSNSPRNEIMPSNNSKEPSNVLDVLARTAVGMTSNIDATGAKAGEFSRALAQPSAMASLVGPESQQHRPDRADASYPPHKNASQAAMIDDRFGIVIGEPKPSDVLFGHNPEFFLHPGNVKLRSLIENSAGYPPLSDHGRLLLAHRIVNEVKSSGARFLTRQSTSPMGIWYRIEDVEAETLIFRCLEEEETKKLEMLVKDREHSLQALRSSSLGVPMNNTPLQPVPNVDPAQSSIFGLKGRNKSGHSANPLHPSSRDKQTNSQALTNQVPGNSISGATRLDFSQLSNSQQAQLFQTQTAENKAKETLVLSSSASSSNAESVVDEEEDDNSNDTEHAKEEDGSSYKMPPGVGEHDVICGRGRGNFRHPGNRRMLRMFYNVKDCYNKSSKANKTLIGHAIVSEIKSKGGRFLKHTDHGWEEVDKTTVLRKVCHGIRDIPSDPAFRKRSVVAKELGHPNGASLPPIIQAFQTKTASEIPRSTKPKPVAEQRSRNVAEAQLVPQNTQARKLSHQSSQGTSDTQDVAPDAAKESAGTEIQGSKQKKRPKEPKGEIVTNPTDQDILCGRGRGFFTHPGNRRMSDIFHANMDRYQNASRAEKTQVTRSVLNELLSNGARFLKRVDGHDDMWETIGPADALNKVGHGIRDLISAREEGKLRPKFLKLGMVKIDDDDDDNGGSRSQEEAQPRQASGANRHYRYADSSPSFQHDGSMLREYAVSGLRASSQLPGAEPTLFHGGGALSNGLSLQLMLAARQQAEAEAAAFGTPSGLQGLGGFQGNTPQLGTRDMIFLRERERQRQNGFLG